MSFSAEVYKCDWSGEIVSIAGGAIQAAPSR
jgi:hypothetical protein